MKTAQHKALEDTFVKWERIKDFLGDTIIRIVFSNGETSTMSVKRFKELYKEI